ncbi:uncharacterized protein C8Q71DRAFT_769742 [Rhodofomes roseus]|uniref:HNH nuclease domain-containing protein n=1 Tax=Rhodofomes roseus TaxID=34475 RepID=A0ABQ8KC17_9APHY|nr:uncharacterized protein C8Q71DRAFT_769742 [Rhodofomes roseus]KAH9834595.1 hypothetical protein C8Q71DRAFT_769742 [Rhodofomes roseus]
MAYTSIVSQARNANIFFWWPSLAEPEVMACWDSSVVGPVTAKWVLRWVNMIAPPIAGGAGVMEVRRVSLEQDEVIRFKYHLFPEETMIPSAVLEPGVYGCYYMPDKELEFDRVGSLLNSFQSTISMADLKKDLETEEPKTSAGTGCLKRYIIPTDLLAEASSHDADGNCVFMGYKGKNSQYPVELHWIFPPGMARFRTHGPKMLTTEEFQNAQNLMTVRSDICHLWHLNAFSVDVDDDYRIRVFDKRATNVGLPARIDPVLNSAAERFFREHFRFTLSVNWGGGDAYDEFPLRHAPEAPVVDDTSTPSYSDSDEGSGATDSEPEDFAFEVTARLEALHG